MGARIPPNERPRRGGISCEFCGRAVPSAAALESHQAALHSQALKEKAKVKPAATKPSKVQKPELCNVSNVNTKDKAEKEKVEAASKTPQKKVSVQSVTKTPTAKPKTDAAKPKIDAAKPKIDAAKPKIDAVKPKIDAAKPKIDAAKPKIDAAKPKIDAAKPKADDTVRVSISGREPRTVNSKPKTEISVKKPEEKPSQSPAMEGKMKPVTQRKVEYKCPKCEKLFPVQFIAQKHIQRYHRINSNGEAVAENSPDIIQPILLEMCKYCDKKVSKPHNCLNRSDAHLMSYTCFGCHEQFNNNKLFDLHVANMHGDNGESMFFPSEQEFITWKEEMETQTASKYVLMGKYNSKQIYQCCEFDSDSENALILCPASFVLTKYPKGLQIHFYPTHYEHEYNEYKLQDKYKTFTINELIHQAENACGSSDEDLYLQFKTLMESLVLDAAKLNIDTLKTLMNKAKEMETILQDYDEDKELEMVKGRFTISLSTRNTSKTEETSSESSPARTRKRTIKENGTDTEPLKKKLRSSTGDTKTVVKSTGDTKTDVKSTGDTKTVVKSTGDTKTVVKSTGDTKTIVKPTNKKSFSLADDKYVKDILKELDSGNVQPRDKTMQSPSFTDAYKDFIMNTSKPGVPKAERNTAKKKNVVKTKMGQFKGPSPKKIVNRNSFGFTKDIEYEVRERDEDCNILILKI